MLFTTQVPILAISSKAKPRKQKEKRLLIKLFPELSKPCYLRVQANENGQKNNELKLNSLTVSLTPVVLFVTR